MANPASGRRINIVARGNLTIMGWEQPRIFVNNGERNTQVREQADVTYLDSAGNCDVQVPHNAAVHVLECRGNLKVDDVEHLTAHGVRGNVHLNGVNSVGLSGVGGNLHAEDTVLLGSDEMIGVGGNAAFRLDQRSGPRLSISAGGHMRVNASALSSARIRSRSGQGNRSIVIGSGEIELTFNSGGRQKIDLPNGANDAAASQHASGWGEELGDILGGLGNRLGDELGEALQIRINQRVARSIDRATRSAARSHAGTHWSFGWGNSPTPPAPPPPQEPISDEERLAILRMLQDKKISSAQAESLLAALEM